MYFYRIVYQNKIVVMKKRSQVLLILLLANIVVFSQISPLTIAESSDYKSTSRYEDVMLFINELSNTSSFLRIDTIAKTTDGFDVPMMIVANPLPISPIDVGDRIVVYLQANIHAGEVEGKEAVQMLVRDLLADTESEIMKNVVIIVTPILNVDGNEKISVDNRKNQVGPENGVGIRYNGQNLDLNRDAMKLETPELKGVVENILNVWDPAISVDCHTTNGSFHEEPITFTWMQNPNGDRELINFMRDEMMPSVHDTLWDKYGVENIFYGVFVDRMDYSKGWVSYASEPRYLVNYIGLRNRLAILNENYVYADYKTRVLGCYDFLRTVLEYSSYNKKQIIRLLADADKRSMENGLLTSDIDSFAIDYKGKPTPELITIKAFETDTIPGVVGYWRYKSSDRKTTVTVPYIADYYATESVKTPYAYLISKTDPRTVELLLSHGLEINKLNEKTTLIVEEFQFENIAPSQRLNQGHYTNQISGEFVSVEKEFAAGTIIVYTDQKLGSLASALLEPEAKDGMLKWNFFDSYLVPQWGRGYYPYPVYKMMSNINLESN